METKSENSHKNKVHKILAHSYFVFFLLFLIGVYLDLVFGFKIFNNSSWMFAGIVFLVLGTFLIVWAQGTSRKLKKETISKETFYHGPYCFTRSPTHWGLFLLILGFGLIINSFFIILSAFISLILGKLFFLDKEEKVLAEKYGIPYLEYKKSVRF